MKVILIEDGRSVGSTRKEKEKEFITFGVTEEVSGGGGGGNAGSGKRVRGQRVRKLNYFVARPSVNERQRNKIRWLRKLSKAFPNYLYRRNRNSSFSYQIEFDR